MKNISKARFSEVEKLLPLEALIKEFPWGETKTRSLIKSNSLPFLIKIGRSYFYYASSCMEYFTNLEGKEV